MDSALHFFKNKVNTSNLETMMPGDRWTTEIITCRFPKTRSLISQVLHINRVAVAYKTLQNKQILWIIKMLRKQADLINTHISEE